MQGSGGLALALPSLTGMTCIDWGIAMGTITWPANLNRVVLCTKGNNDIGQAREVLAETAISHGCRYLFFLDDDVVVPSDCLLKLTSLLNQNMPDIGKVGAVTGIYTTKDAASSPHVYFKMGEGASWHWKVGTTFEVANCGAGCLLIDLDTLKKLPKPWFKFTAEPNCMIGEDIHFCELLRTHGYKLLAHGGVLCKHYSVAEQKFYELDPKSPPFQTDAAPMSDNGSQGPVA